MARKYKSTITDLSYPMAQETQENRQAMVINCLSLSSFTVSHSTHLGVSSPQRVELLSKLSRTCTKYETCAILQKLHMFLILYISSGLFVFAALRPKSTATVIAGRSVHLTTLFYWASLNKQLTSISCTYFRL